MTQWPSIGGTLVLLALALCSPLTGDDAPAEDKDQAHVARLIEQLGSDDVDEREDAEASLSKLGPAALDALRKGANHPDLEIRKRSRKLLAVIEQKLLAAAVLAPRRLKLKLKDVTVAEAVAHLSKESGYRIDVSASEDAGKRKLTLDVGDATFNEALDALCKAAELTQAFPSSATKGKKGDKSTKGEKGTKKGAPIRTTPESIALREGKSADRPTVYAGSVRLRVAPPTKGPREGAYSLTFETTAEPRLIRFRVVRVVIEKAIDDQGQALETVAAPPSKKGRDDAIDSPWGSSTKASSRLDRTTTVALKKGQKAAESLRELSGYVVVSTLHEFGPVATLDDALKAAGKTASTRPGYSLKVDSIERPDEGKGEVKLTATVSMPLAEELDRSGLRLNTSVFDPDRPSSKGSAITPRVPPSIRLTDDKGRPWEVVGTPSRTERIAGEKRECTVVVRYRPPEANATATKLSLYLTETAGVAVPFALKGVPLK